MKRPSRSRNPGLLQRRLRPLREREDFDAVLGEYRAIARNDALFPHELVDRGVCIQVATERTPESLSDAEKAFRQALAIDEFHVPAILELAHFLFAIQDDAEGAVPLFQEAERIAREQLKEASEALADCEAEIALSGENAGQVEGPQ